MLAAVSAMGRVESKGQGGVSGQLLWGGRVQGYLEGCVTGCVGGEGCLETGTLR